MAHKLNPMELVDFEKLPEIRHIYHTGLTAEQLISMVIQGIAFRPDPRLLKRITTEEIFFGFVLGPYVYHDAKGKLHNCNQTLGTKKYNWIIVNLTNTKIISYSYGHTFRRFELVAGNPTELLRGISEKLGVQADG